MVHPFSTGISGVLATAHSAASKSSQDLARAHLCSLVAFLPSPKCSTPLHLYSPAQVSLPSSTSQKKVRYPPHHTYIYISCPPTPQHSSGLHFISHASLPHHTTGDRVCLVYHCLWRTDSKQTFNMHLKTDSSFRLHSSPRGPGLTESLRTEEATHDRTIRSRYKYFNYLSALEIKNLHWNTSFLVRTYTFSSVAQRGIKNNYMEVIISEVHWSCYSKSAIHSKILTRQLYSGPCYSTFPYMSGKQWTIRSFSCMLPMAWPGIR